MVGLGGREPTAAGVDRKAAGWTWAELV